MKLAVQLQISVKFRKFQGLILHVSRQQKTKVLNSLLSNARSSDSLWVFFICKECGFL